MVSEVYLAPRVTAAATKLLPELKLIPGFALDLTTETDASRGLSNVYGVLDVATNQQQDTRPVRSGAGEEAGYYSP